MGSKFSKWFSFSILFIDEPYFSFLKLDAAGLSETFFPMCHYTRHYVLEKMHCQHVYENLKCNLLLLQSPRNMATKFENIKYITGWLVWFF